MKYYAELENTFIVLVQEALTRERLREEDILWVGNKEKFLTWSEVKGLKEGNAPIYESWGKDENTRWREVFFKTSCLVVGSNWWFEMKERNGDYWLEFKRQPIKPEVKGDGSVIGVIWEE